MPGDRCLRRREPPAGSMRGRPRDRTGRTCFDADNSYYGSYGFWYAIQAVGCDISNAVWEGFPRLDYGRAGLFARSGVGLTAGLIWSDPSPFGRARPVPVPRRRAGGGRGGAETWRPPPMIPRRTRFAADGQPGTDRPCPAGRFPGDPLPDRAVSRVPPIPLGGVRSEHHFPIARRIGRRCAHPHSWVTASFAPR